MFIKYRAGPGEPVAEVMGFNVPAGRDLATRDRYRLERLCRYLVRRAARRWPRALSHAPQLSTSGHIENALEC